MLGRIVIKALPTIIKLKKRELDILLRELSELRHKQDAFQQKMRTFVEEVTEEKRIFNELGYSPEMSEYLNQARTIIEQYNAEIEKLEYQIKDMQDIIFNHFSELKKNEIILDSLSQELSRRQDHLESKEMDEIAILCNHRNKYGIFTKSQN